MIKGKRVLAADIEPPLRRVDKPTTDFRWLGKRGTTTEPRRLQQRIYFEMVNFEFKVVGGGEEWRDIPLVLED